MESRLGKSRNPRQEARTAVGRVLTEGRRRRVQFLFAGFLKLSFLPYVHCSRWATKKQEEGQANQRVIWKYSRAVSGLMEVFIGTRCCLVVIVVFASWF